MLSLEQQQGAPIAQEAPGTRMVVCTPADEVTSAAVASLIASEGAQVQYPCWAEHHRQQATAVSA